MKKILLSLTILFTLSLFFPHSVHAQKADDSRCWEKTKCIEARTRTFHLVDQKPEDGFVQNVETIQACGTTKDVSGKKEPMGFCLPVGSTETKIGIGGKRKFSDIADFIRYSYRYAIMVAGLVSVLMIIVAGFQWATSGGNSASIQNARKRIEGALMGLTVAVLSYSILNFVNPNLVNFRPPQIWMVNKAELLKSDYCADQDATKRLALFRTQEQEKDNKLETKVIDERRKGPYNIIPDQGVCGTRYFIDGTPGQSCRGTLCPSPTQICAAAPDNSGYDFCYDADIVGKITSSGALVPCEDWEDFPWVDPGEEEFRGLCANGEHFEIPTTVNPVQNESGKIYQFLMKIQGAGSDPVAAVEDKIRSECGGTEVSNFKGFFFKVEMNENFDPKDENHYIGNYGGVGTDLGDDSLFNNKVAPTINPIFLFSLEDFKKNKGKLRVNFNMEDIYDFDNREVLNPLCKTDQLESIIMKKINP